MLHNMKSIKYSVCFKIPRTYIFVPNIFMFPILNALVSENYLRFKILDTRITSNIKNNRRWIIIGLKKFLVNVIDKETL